MLNPDGTTTAWNKDRTKVLHSHGPPPEPGNTPDADLDLPLRAASPMAR